MILHATAWMSLAVSLMPIAIAHKTAQTALWCFSAFAAGLVAMGGAPYSYQLLAFLSGMAVSWVLGRRYTIPRLRSAQDAAMIDDIVGRPGTVIKPITGPAPLGAVRVGSTIWPAKASEPIAAGREVLVEDLLDGVLKVRPAPR